MIAKDGALLGMLREDGTFLFAFPSSAGCQDRKKMEKALAKGRKLAVNGVRLVLVERTWTTRILECR